MLYVANAFSLNMIAASLRERCALSVMTLTLDEARSLLARAESDRSKPTWTSAVGHPTTAAVFSSELDRPVACLRPTIELTAEDRVLVGQPIGDRLPEGATTLPAGTRIEWLLVRFIRVDMSEPSRYASHIDEGWMVCHAATTALTTAGVPFHRDSFDRESALQTLDEVVNGVARRTWQVALGATPEQEAEAIAQLRVEAGIDPEASPLKRVVGVLLLGNWMMGGPGEKFYTKGLDVASQLANFDTLEAALAEEWKPTEKLLIDRARRVVGLA
jgi:hypothetical protein